MPKKIKQRKTKVRLLSNGVRVEIRHDPLNLIKLFFWIEWNPGDQNFENYVVYGSTPKEAIGRLRQAIAEYYNPEIEKVRRRLGVDDKITLISDGRTWHKI